MCLLYFFGVGYLYEYIFVRDFWRAVRTIALYFNCRGCVVCACEVGIGGASTLARAHTRKRPQAAPCTFLPSPHSQPMNPKTKAASRGPAALAASAYIPPPYGGLAPGLPSGVCRGEEKKKPRLRLRTIIIAGNAFRLPLLLKKVHGVVTEVPPEVTPRLHHYARFLPKDSTLTHTMGRRAPGRPWQRARTAGTIKNEVHACVYTTTPQRPCAQVHACLGRRASRFIVRVADTVPESI